MRQVAADLLSRARGGDANAFRDLTEPYRRELQVHCYRMLGSLQDAEDAFQETLLAAWRGFARFEDRSSLRTWLYRVATNRCLDARRAASRRPPKEWDVPGVERPEPTRLGEVVWLEPYPDALLEVAADMPLGPGARYAQSESISLAFVTALQLLPPRQLAVPCRRGRPDAQFQCRLGQQRIEKGAGHPEGPFFGDRRPRSAPFGKVARRERGRREIRARMGIRGSRGACGPFDGRRVHLDAPNAVRVHRPRGRCSLLCRAPTRGEGSTSSPQGRTVSRHSPPTCASQAGLVGGWACTSSRWPVTASARWPVLRTACSRSLGSQAPSRADSPLASR
jgi:RNA polymerase sigma factor (sigma-70 family)